MHDNVPPCDDTPRGGFVSDVCRQLLRLSFRCTRVVFSQDSVQSRDHCVLLLVPAVVTLLAHALSAFLSLLTLAVVFLGESGVGKC